MVVIKQVRNVQYAPTAYGFRIYKKKDEARHCLINPATLEHITDNDWFNVNSRKFINPEDFREYKEDRYSVAYVNHKTGIISFIEKTNYGMRMRLEQEGYQVLYSDDVEEING